MMGSDTPGCAPGQATGRPSDQALDQATGQALDQASGLIAEALMLAAQGRGATSPNPMVGAIVLDRDGQIRGRGFHPKAGAPHAEIFALREAGDAARGGTIAVTLEPCCHTGRTGPCTQAIIDAGIAKVIVGASDPNPLVAGRGLQILRDAGVDVVSGVRAEACSRLNAAFNHWIIHRTPWVTLKLATSIDGKIAAHTGTSQWITGPIARARVHAMRAASDAVMVGRRTAEIDDPRLTARDLAEPRPAGWRAPARIVLDPDASLPRDLKAMDAESPGEAILVTALEPDHPSLHSWRGAGVTTLSLADPTHPGRIDLPALMRKLGGREQRPITSLLVEGGGGLARSLLRAGLIDALVIHQAPVIVGDDGVGAFASLGLRAPADGTRWRRTGATALGDDIELVFSPLPSPGKRRPIDREEP